MTRDERIHEFEETIARLEARVKELDKECQQRHDDFILQYDDNLTLRDQRDRLEAKLKLAEAVGVALEKHFGPEYASDNWNIRNATRTALATWRKAREEGK